MHRRSAQYKKLGFDGVQFHDDDVVPADLSPAETELPRRRQDQEDARR